jgi:hypothetical protein
MEHAPAPWPDAEPDPQPGFRAGFEAEGFRLLGAEVLVRPAGAELARLAAGYAPDDRRQFVANGQRPAQVLASPDGTAFVRLGWFWSMRWAEVTTVLADGGLVTTAADWGGDPAWPRTIRRWYSRTTDRRREQVLWAAPSRSARVVDGDADRIWAEHRAHVRDVAGPDADLPPHVDLASAVAVHDAAQECRIRMAGRAQVLSWLAGLLVAVGLVSTVPALTLAQRGPSWQAGVALVLVGYVVWNAVQKQVWLRARHWRRLCPRLRAPLPASVPG